MSTKLVPIKWFIDFLDKQLNESAGYIMGSTGQDPSKWNINSWWFNQYKSNSRQYKKALYWRSHAQRVFDCNGLSEGAYQDYTGININSKARYNYALWCNPKGTGVIPSNQRRAGMAVFKRGSSSSIHHVGYLLRPVDSRKPEGDWYICEAKGVMYGVVRTKLSDGGWDYWGMMSKYFDYSDADTEVETEPTVTYATIRKGSTGADVKALQEILIAQGYDLGSYGADGDFGAKTDAAVRKYQSAHGLTVDGIVGKQTWAVLTGEESA